jgi:hypothetical protein
MKMIYLLLLLSMSTAPATEAEQDTVFEQKHVDLNKDDVKDIVTVVKTSLDNRVIIIEEVTPVAKKSKDKTGDIVAAINVGRNKTSFDDVEINSAGGLSIFSGCDVCGRETTITEYKIAYRNGQYIVAGYTLNKADRQTATFSSCDVNLLTGDAELNIGDEKTREKGDDRYFNVAELAAGYKPTVCDEVK